MAKQINGLKLEDLLPSSIATQEDIRLTSEAIDPELQLTVLIQQLTIYGRIPELASNWLDQLAWQWHVDVYEPTDLTVEQKRYIVQTALMMHRFKGTRWAIKNSLTTLGFDRIIIKEHWELHSKPYTFAVELSPMTEKLISDARRFIEAYKPARSQLLYIDFRMCISDEEHSYDKLVQHLGAHLSETLPMTETGREQLSAAVQPFFDESPWFRHLYSEDGLLYDGSIRYDSQDESVEYIGIRRYSVLNDTPQSQDGIVSVLKIII